MNKSKIKSILGILLLVVCMIYFFWDVLDLFNTEDRHTVNVVYSYEALEVTHKLFYIIPIGKDHYFLAYDEDENGNINGYVVKASHEWYEENFSAGTGFAVDLNVEIDSLSKSYRTRWYKEVEDQAYEFQNLLLDQGSNVIVNYPYGLDHCFVLDYKSTAIKKLVMLILNIALVAVGIVVVKRKQTINSILGRIYGVVVLADVIYFLILLFNSM